MVLARHLQGDGPLRIVLAHQHGPRPEGFEGQSPAHAGLVDVGEDTVEIGPAGQLLFHLVDVLLHLQFLLAQLRQVRGLVELRAEFLPQHLFTAPLRLQARGSIRQHHGPARQDHEQQRHAPHRRLGQERPLPGLTGIQALKLHGSPLQELAKVQRRQAPGSKGRERGHRFDQDVEGPVGLLGTGSAAGLLTFNLMENS